MDAETKKRVWDMLEALESVDLTKWEENFIGSLMTYVTEKGRITPRQLEVLEKIYEQRKP